MTTKHDTPIPPQVEVRQHLGRPQAFIDGQPYALAGFNTFGKEAFDRSMGLAYPHKMEVYFLQPEMPGAWPETRFWVGDQIDGNPPMPAGNFDLDAQAAHVLQGDPDADLFVRFTIWPPASWTALHPQEAFVTETGVPLAHASLASDLFFDTAARFTAALVRFCESRPWACRVIGYANFHVCEGTHPPVMAGWLYDHGPPMTRRWRDFLRAKYGTEEQLRDAYGDPSLTFETALVPRDRLRGSLPEVAQQLYWQERRENQPLRDYLELTRDLWHLRFRQQGAAMQAAAPRRVLMLHDALKQVMLGWSNYGFFNYPRGGEGVSWSPAFVDMVAGSGHLGVAPLFGAPGCDGLITPHDYQARGIGGVYETEGIADSAVLRGKLLYGEMDTRTWVRTANEIGLARDVCEYAANTWRNLATGFTRGYHSYWMEFGAGWFDPEEIRQVIRRQVEVIKESVHWPHQTVPGIAMILDDQAVLETNGAGNYFNEAIMWEWKMGLARCGVPHNIYLLEDLELDNFPRHRVYYFPNLFRVDEARLELLRRKVFCDGALVVWGPGSGISDGERIGTESASRLTGFEFELIRANAQRRVLIANFDHPITRDLEPDLVLGGPLPYGPVLLPKDCLELGLAWAKGGFNHIGLGLKEFGRGAGKDRGPGDWAGVFSTAVNLPAKLWRNLARYAGAHVYCESNDVLLANSSVVALHSLKSGEKQLSLPGVCRVRDLISGEEYSPATDQIHFTLRAPETRVFLLGQ